jgi:hypothetical protein
MPIDPRIPLGVNPPQIQSPFEAIGAIAQLQGIREQTEARRLAAEAARTKHLRQQQIDAAYNGAVSVDPTTGKIKIDRAKLVADLPGSLVPGVMSELDKDEANALEIQTKTLELAKAKQTHLRSAADTVAAADYDPVMFGVQLKGAHKLGALSDEDYDRFSAISDPAQIKALIDGFRTQAKPAEPFTLGPGQVRYGPRGEVVATGPAKVEEAPTIGSFEDYVARAAAQEGRDVKTLSTKDIDRYRETYRLDPRITIKTPREVTPTAALNMTRSLRNDFTKETGAARTIEAQLANMKSSLQAVKAGQAPAGSQGVLVTFQKILDPTSVVRESEYARSASGLSLLGRLEGQWMRLQQGGAGVTVKDLEQFVALADQFAQNQRRAAAETKSQIDAIATEYGLKPELITREIGAPPADQNQTAPPPPPPPGGAKAPAKVGERRTINGQLAEWDGKGWKAVR